MRYLQTENRTAAIMLQGHDRERDWLDHATALPGLSLVELTPAILVGSCDLPQPFHGDPADQIIVATARNHHATLVSKDGKLRSYPHVQTAW